jgi:Beta-ketoacyl synthase, N-terminal domain
MRASEVSLISASNNHGTDNSLLVGSVGLWLPGVASVEEFKQGARGLDVSGSEYAPPGGKSIEVRSRRRASRLSRALADVCAEAVSGAGIDAATVPTVFGSTLGEAATMISLLDQMWRGQEMSPMAFATSVHSAASGVVSISSQNRGFTTSLSADFDTTAAALMEGWGLVHAMRTPVVVVCGDDDSPKDFVPEPQAFDLMAVAISLCPLDYRFPEGHGPLGRISWPEPSRVAGGRTLDPVSVSTRVGRNPQAGMLDLVAAVLARQSGLVRLDRGNGSGQCISFTANH